MTSCDPELNHTIGLQDLVVASNFLCHMENRCAEECLRNLAGFVSPGGYLFVSGVDLDVRTKVALDLGWKPVSELWAEIHDGDPSVRADWPWQWWGVEPIDRRRPDWQARYTCAFQIGTQDSEADSALTPRENAVQQCMASDPSDEAGFAAAISDAAVGATSDPGDNNASGESSGGENRLSPNGHTMTSSLSQYYSPEVFGKTKRLHYQKLIQAPFWPTFIARLRSEHPAVGEWLESSWPVSNGNERRRAFRRPSASL